MDARDDRFNASYRLPPEERLSLADRWILSRLQYTQDEVSRLIDGWQLGEAGRQLYDFLWSEYCDWYIEAAKTRLYEGAEQEANDTRQVLAFVLEQSLRLLHPFMPFVTESIWQNLPGFNGDGRALIVARWPAVSGFQDLQDEESFERLQEAVRAIRNVRSEYNVEPARRISAMFSTGDQEELINNNLDVIVNLARLTRDETIVGREVDSPEKAVTLAVGGITVHLPLAGMVDLEAERARINTELAKTEEQIERSENLLANPGFVNKAPEAVVVRERDKLEQLVDRQRQLVEHLQEI